MAPKEASLRMARQLDPPYSLITLAVGVFAEAAESVLREPVQARQPRRGRRQGMLGVNAQ